jgi:PAS domain S-box-containing protein
MTRVLILCIEGDIRKKIFSLINSDNENNFYFFDTLSNVYGEFNDIKPDYFILDAKTYNSLVDRNFHSSVNTSGCKMIIIKNEDLKIINYPLKSISCLSTEFSKRDLYEALGHSDQKNSIATDRDVQNEKSYLQILMDNIPDTIYFKDTESRFTRINLAKAKTLGLKDISEAVGKSDKDFFDPARAKQTFHDEQKLFKTGVPIINKVEHFKIAGENKYLSATKIPIIDQKGEIRGLVGISRDITKSKEFEKKLIKEQDLLKALMDNIPDKIFFKDRNSRFIRVNKAWAKKYNIENTDEVIGKADTDFFNKSFAEETFLEEQLLMETEQPLINKLERKTKEDGKESYKLVSKVPIKSKNGNITGLVGISHDITELKLTEKKLATEKELLQSLMDNIPDLIYFKNLKSEFIRINNAQATLLGLTSPDEAIGKTDFNFFPKPQAEIAFRDEQMMYRTGLPIINNIVKMSPPNNEAIWMSATKIPIHNDKGEITGLFGISRDITLMELARENLEYAKQKAEESNRAKSQFLANMSHEIRTPMNGIIGMADILSYTNLTAEQKNYVDIIIKSGNSLISIINDILDLSKIEANKLTLEKMPISIRSIMEDVADLLVVAANNKNLEFANYVDPMIPDVVEGDVVRMRQILINLVNNAIKFTHHGEVFFSAELEESNPNGFKIRFKIKDTGIGIPQNVKSSLFQPFMQVDNSATRKFEGTGLGLAISKRLTEMMGGEIGVESEEGKGSLFWFTACFGTANEIKPSQRLPKLLIEDLNVLIVDDNKTNRYIFSKYLETCNCKYKEAYNAELAIKMLNRASEIGNPFDIALLDYQMAEMDGIDLAKNIKSNPAIADTRLILLSSVSDLFLPSQVREKGFEYFLNKPVKLNDLYSAISVVAGNKEDKGFRHKLRTKKAAALHILIAEDNPINVRVAQIITKPYSLLTDVVENGQLAFDKYKGENYDLILMDLQMPVLDGYQATELIREYEQANNKPPVKIVAMTANAMKEDMENCLKIGMDGYLSKPFRIDDMIKILEELKLLNL